MSYDPNILKCGICGAEEHLNKWNEETKTELCDNLMCFECNFWRSQHEKDIEIGEHDYAILDGVHYRLLKEDPNSYFKGYGGRKVVFKFKDGTVKECRNVWCQGDISKHWRTVMPDNVDEIDWNCDQSNNKNEIKVKI